MKKLRYGIGLTAILGGCALTLLVVIPSSQTLAHNAPDPVRALVLNDLGAYASVVTSMQTRGWEVTTAGVLEVQAGGADFLLPFDIVWIPAQANLPGLQELAKTGGVLDLFAYGGGVVAVMDITPDDLWLDIAPGGSDAEALPAAGAGTVTIAAATHPLITGTGIGGQPLVDANLDPQATGGRGCVLNAPDESNAVVIAQNTIGPVVLEHSRGTGHIFVCALLNQAESCTENIVLYVQSLTE